MPRTRPAPPPLDDLDATLERVALADVRPHPRNYQQHPEAEIAHLMQSLTTHGVYRNVVIARDGTLLAGHGVVDAARRLGYTHLTMKRLDVDPNEPDALQVLVGDNEIARLAVKEADALVVLLEELRQEDPALLFGTGFDEATLKALAEAQGLLPGHGTEEAGRDVEPQIDRAEELRKEWGTEVGQVWSLGEHRLICGDCTDKAVVERLMQQEKAVLCHADPPYGMGKEAEGIANDNLYASKLDAFQMQWWTVARRVLTNNASIYIWGNAEDLWRLWYVGGLRDSERLTLRNELVWNKGDSGAGVVSLQGSDGLRKYPPGSERCLFFMRGEQGFSTNADNYWDGWEPIRSYLEQERLAMGWDVPTMKRIVGHSDLSRDHWTSKSQWSFPTQEVYESLQRAAREQAQSKRDYEGFKRDYDEIKRDYMATRSFFDNGHDLMLDVWDCPRVKGEERWDHPTPKPLGLIERIVKSSADVGAFIYEPFLGSGTTMVAAHNLGRRCFGCEIDPGYTAVCLERFFQLTGVKPQLVDR